MGRVLTEEDVRFALKGGAVFACGGGGWIEHGRQLGIAATMGGWPELIGVDELDDDAWVATAAAIGAPGESTDWQMLGVDYVNAVRLLQKELGEPIAALMIGQNGMSSTLNAWLPSAMLGCKVLDAVGDVRAHPTGDMGSIGLARDPSPTIQVAVGGNRKQGRYLELVVRGATAKVSPVLRKAADMSGGFIASCRNPIRASYVRQHAALGGISLALRLGESIVAAEDSGRDAILSAICQQTGGKILASGVVKERNLRYTGEAFDVGYFEIACAQGMVRLHVMNEYMAVDAGSERLATYPDVITTLTEDGSPVSAGRVKVGDRIDIFHVHRSRLPLSSSVKDPSVYPPVEHAMGIELRSYLPDLVELSATV